MGVGGSLAYHHLALAVFYLLDARGENSCARTEADSIACTYFVVAGLLMSEIREALSGRPVRNVRYVARRFDQNQIVRMATPAECREGCDRRRKGVETPAAG